jgi:hypothetical protein
MAKFIIKPRVIDLYEIVEVRPILLYHTYEITIDYNGYFISVIINDKSPEVGDYITSDTHFPKIIKKAELCFYKEAE